ncbi:uncharacterized protein LOC124418900 [Lucilia cuprina]|uniref:uncharacterized protein LOC124418900 n=1 Tax=Lucilia cuprina TaxID=7375 RepID=UPI001F06B30F|nr:uncharacterized protein LOC124418900 [Lucilia cuprina]
MKFSVTFALVILVILQLCLTISAKPPKGGIGDGYIYPVTKMGTKPKKTTTYYAKPLHPPKPKPKLQVYKVIIHDQPAKNAPPPKQEQIFKIITLPKHSGQHGGGISHAGKSVKILKILHVKQSNGGHGGGWGK